MDEDGLINTTEADRPMRVPKHPFQSLDFVRMTVVNNSQIIASASRTGLILSFAGSVAALIARVLTQDLLHHLFVTAAVGFVVAGAAFELHTYFLDRALRLCPVCRTRITKKTEETRHCMECNVALWDYWDE